MLLALNDHNIFYCETDQNTTGFLEEVVAHLQLTDRVERYTKVCLIIVASHGAHNPSTSKLQ
jgi:hypothetical protein